MKKWKIGALGVALLGLTLGIALPVMAQPGDPGGDPLAPGDHTPLSVSPAACSSIPATHDPAVIKVVYNVGQQRGVSAKVLLAAFETGWVESHMNNLNCGDRDSLGVFQQRPSQGWGTPEQIMNVSYAAGQFYHYAVINEGRYPGYTAGQLAQSVQRSAYPDRYDQAEGKARAMIDEARGGVTWPTLRAGASGSKVKTLQHLLSSRGHSLTVDGSFGAQTTSAVRAFQQARSLVVDGVVGPQTWSELVTTVRSGSSGGAVKGAQEQLRRHGHAITVDGQFGAQTTAAVKAFQQAKKITADGVVGPQTWRYLLAG